MESLYLLIPLSVVLVLLIGAVLAGAVLSGQFENLQREGERILDEPDEQRGRHDRDLRERREDRDDPADADDRRSVDRHRT
jgi:cbb3-type cytochrome oxidase maturation protein